MRSSVGMMTFPRPTYCNPPTTNHPLRPTSPTNPMNWDGKSRASAGLHTYGSCSSQGHARCHWPPGSTWWDRWDLRRLQPSTLEPMATAHFVCKIVPNHQDAGCDSLVIKHGNGKSPEQANQSRSHKKKVSQKSYPAKE